MRAVNLIPEDARRGGGAGGAGRSGGAVYVLLGGLAVVVALVAAWAFTGRSVSHDKTELDAIKAQIAQAQAQAPAQTTQQAQGPSIEERLATVRALVVARQDWARTLDAVARTLPSDTTLNSLDASTTPSASPGGAAATGGIASSSTGPSIQIAGCAPSQKAVAELMPRLRIIPGVQNVSLASSTKAAAGADTGTTGSCAGVDFEMVLFLEAAAPPPTGTATPATATATAAPAPAPTTGATQ